MDFMEADNYELEELLAKQFRPAQQPDKSDQLAAAQSWEEYTQILTQSDHDLASEHATDCWCEQPFDPGVDYGF